MWLVLSTVGGVYEHKYAFQWDAYHPLVDRIPACTAHRGCVSQHALGRGYLPRGCLPRWCLPMGVSVWVVSAQGVCSRHPPLNRMTDRQV